MPVSVVVGCGGGSVGGHGRRSIGGGDVVVCRDPIWDGRVKMTCRSNGEGDRRGS